MIKLTLNPEYARSLAQYLEFFHKTHPLIKQINRQLEQGETDIRISTTDGDGRVETWILERKDKLKRLTMSDHWNMLTHEHSPFTFHN